MLDSAVLNPESVTRSSLSRSGGRVLIAGAGHIGAFLPPLVARTGIVKLIRVVDRGRVTLSHVQSEGYPASAVGCFKSDVLVERWASEFPTVTFESRPQDLEDVPLGDFDVDVCLGALDSLRARQVLACESAFPLGVSVVDGGVGESRFGCVQVFQAGSACLECGFGPKHYRHLATEYPCQPDGTYNAPSTRAPAFLGSVVAGLMVAEMVSILCGPEQTDSREIFFDLVSRRFLSSRLARAKNCRFKHEVIQECRRLDTPLDAATIGDVLQVIDTYYGSSVEQLEFRRRLIPDDGMFGFHRLISPQLLIRMASKRIRDLGLTSRDRIRLYFAGRSGSAFLSLADSIESKRVMP